MKDLIYVFKFKSNFTYKVLYIYSLVRKICSKLLFNSHKSSYITTNHDYIIENEHWTYKVFEPSDMHAILKPHNEEEILKFFELNDWIFLDIWWNVWKYSIYVARQSKSNKVFTFEPNPFLYNNYLKQNIQLNNLSNINTFNQWLSEMKWKLNLHIPIWNNFGSASLLSDKESNTKEVEVEINTLDDFIQGNSIDISQINLIKIDVEWFELNVLKWSINTLKNLNWVKIIIEISEDYEEICEIFSKNWFKVLFKHWINFVYEK